MALREKILVVDRNERFLEKTREILSRDGYRVHVCGDFTSAKVALGEFSPDIVLAGVHLPGGNGYEFVRHVKDRHDPAVPCVLLFSKDDDETVTRCLESGAENYLLRPLKRREVVSCVRDMVLIRRLKRRLAAVQPPVVPATVPADPPETVLEPRTRFYTFAHFKEVLWREVKRARRYQYALSLMLLAYDQDVLHDVEVDGARDELLAQLYGGLALAVRRSVRDTDIPVSYTPGNILILMPHTDLDGAVAVARRLRAAIKRSRIEVAGRQLTPGLSIGLAASTRPEETSFSHLVKDATKALAFAARKGGNCIVH